MTRLFIALIILLTIAAESIGKTSAAPANILIAQDRTEPSIAVDPRQQGVVVISTNTNYDQPRGSAYPTGYFASGNGGKSFVGGTAPMIAPYTTGADTTVAIDGNGTVFYSYLGETPAYCSSGRSAVVLTHSIDHGRSFRAPRIVDANAADDKPNMAVQTIPGGSSRLFFTWTRWHDSAGTSDIWFSRSLDGGVTFSSPEELFSSHGNNMGSVPVAGAGKHVFVFWMASPDAGDSKSAQARVMMSASSNGGQSFTAARPASPTFTRLPLMAMPGSLRNLTMPAAIAAPDGTLYLAWGQVRRIDANGSAHTDIVVSRSTDNGWSWSTPAAVNDTSRGDRFMPAISVMADDSLGVAFYDRRGGGNDLQVYADRVWFDHVLHASRNVRVSRGTSPIGDIQYLAPGSTCFVPGRFFGDYIGAAASGARLAVAWGDTQLHQPNQTDIWFARVRLPGRSLAVPDATLSGGR